MRIKLGFLSMFKEKVRLSVWKEAEVFFWEGSAHFLGGRVAAISGAEESPRERLSVGTDHPDSGEHNTRGAG